MSKMAALAIDRKRIGGLNNVVSGPRMPCCRPCRAELLRATLSRANTGIKTNLIICARTWRAPGAYYEL
jgi:hypothetical protein